MQVQSTPTPLLAQSKHSPVLKCAGVLGFVVSTDWSRAVQGSPHPMLAAHCSTSRELPVSEVVQTHAVATSVLV
jgi:hypothetical protein